MNIYDRIKALCIENDTTISQMCISIGLNKSSGTKWKNGAIPSGEILIKIATFLKCSVELLLDDEFTEDLAFAEKTINMCFKSIMSWSNNKMTSPRKKELIKKHFADTLINYKTLVEAVIDADDVNISCARATENLVGWVKLLPEYMFTEQENQKAKVDKENTYKYWNELLDVLSPANRRKIFDEANYLRYEEEKANEAALSVDISVQLVNPAAPSTYFRAARSSDNASPEFLEDTTGKIETFKNLPKITKAEDL